MKRDVVPRHARRTLTWRPERHPGVVPSCPCPQCTSNRWPPDERQDPKGAKDHQRTGSTCPHVALHLAVGALVGVAAATSAEDNGGAAVGRGNVDSTAKEREGTDGTEDLPKHCGLLFERRLAPLETLTPPCLSCQARDGTPRGSTGPRRCVLHRELASSRTPTDSLNAAFRYR